MPNIIQDKVNVFDLVGDRFVNLTQKAIIQMNTQRTPNALINESSPYLLQHAYNPVHWLPWSNETLERAQKENKPLLISIGYSACHWCHVMEHESFEDEAIAALMNDFFVCIKVDREERPDIDHVYMDAVQLITGQGGWPLNCFALPDGRPFYGGTYFPKQAWKDVLLNVHNAFVNDRKGVENYAQQLIEGIQNLDEMPVQTVPEQFTDEVVAAAITRWGKRFDHKYGGFEGAPKFPMPSNLQILLHYGVFEQDSEVLEHVLFTLKMMAFGGIYDQVGGGFSRYSVDEQWKVPHFEKMLYDNAQLVSLYADAYKVDKNPLYLEVVNATLLFVVREMTGVTGGYCSALDADSEAEEGKFYVYSIDEINMLTGNFLPMFEQYYHLGKRGYWEDGKYILMRQNEDHIVAKNYGIETSILKERVSDFKARALHYREQRPRPGIDDKVLTSWNAMMARAFVDAYLCNSEVEHLELAKSTLDFLLQKLRKPDGSLWHVYKNQHGKVEGYLEDYAHLCDALIRYYEATFDQHYLDHAYALVNHVTKHFDLNPSGFYYFKSRQDQQLVAQKAETHDNVIPSSNAVMATCLYQLGLLYLNTDWLQIAHQMLAQVEASFVRHPSSYSHWMRLMLMVSEPFYEVAILGEDCEQKRKAISEGYHPNTLLCGGINEGTLPILQHRLSPGETLFYVCKRGACQMPVRSVEEARRQLYS